MAFGSYSFIHRKRREIAAAILAALLHSLAWNAGAAGFADVLESEGSNAAVHEQGCTENDSTPSGGTADSHCNEACHFWSQFHIVFATFVAPSMKTASVHQARSPAGAFDNRSTPPFRPPRTSLPV